MARTKKTARRAIGGAAPRVDLRCSMACKYPAKAKLRRTGPCIGSEGTSNNLLVRGARELNGAPQHEGKTDTLGLGRALSGEAKIVWKRFDQQTAKDLAKTTFGPLSSWLDHRGAYELADTAADIMFILLNRSPTADDRRFRQFRKRAVAFRHNTMMLALSLFRLVGTPIDHELLREGFQTIGAIAMSDLMARPSIGGEVAAPHKATCATQTTRPREKLGVNIRSTGGKTAEATPVSHRECTFCGTKHTPQWRFNGTLCNACGSRILKQRKARTRDVYVQAAPVCK